MSIQLLNDNELVQLYVDGNEESLAVLLDRHKRKIFSSIMIIIKNKHLAEDIFQETFFKVIKTLKKRQYNEEGEEISAFNTIASENNETSNQENYMLKKNIRNLITELPGDQREVLIMRMYYDMSFKEISEFTKVSINTSLGRMRYALLNLKKLINERKMEIVY